MQTSGGDYEMLAGNLASIGVGAIIAVLSSLIVRHLPIDLAATRTHFIHYGQVA